MKHIVAGNENMLREDQFDLGYTRGFQRVTQTQMLRNDHRLTTHEPID